MITGERDPKVWDDSVAAGRIANFATPSFGGNLNYRSTTKGLPPGERIAMPKALAAALRPQAQAVLDNLFRNQVLPFELIATKVECLGSNEYIVRFFDSRLRSVDVSWKQDQSFEEAFQAAMVDRVRRLSKDH